MVPGPEAPLVAGIADAMEAAGIPCIGPSREAAQLEGQQDASPRNSAMPPAFPPRSGNASTTRRQRANSSAPRARRSW